MSERIRGGYDDALYKSTFTLLYFYFKTISNKLHFDFQFLEFRNDNRKLFPY